MVPELPAFDARTFTQRLHEKVRKSFGHVLIDGVKHPVVNESGQYVTFDPEGATSFNRFVTGLRGQQDVVERHEVQLVDQKDHLDRIDARENARHAAVDGRLDALEAAHRPFGSGSG